MAKSVLPETDPVVIQATAALGRVLQERGVLRTEYTTTTLRGHLGLSPARRLAEEAHAASA